VKLDLWRNVCWLFFVMMEIISLETRLISTLLLCIFLLMRFWSFVTRLLQFLFGLWLPVQVVHVTLNVAPVILHGVTLALRCFLARLRLVPDTLDRVNVNFRCVHVSFTEMHGTLQEVHVSLCSVNVFLYVLIAVLRLFLHEDSVNIEDVLTICIRIVADFGSRIFQFTTNVVTDYNVHIYNYFGYYFYTLLPAGFNSIFSIHYQFLNVFVLILENTFQYLH